MGVKPGYQQTEVGVIPKDWDVVPFLEIADKSIRWSFAGGPFGSNLKASEYTDEGVRIIQLQNIGDGYFINDYSIFTSESKADELLPNNIFPGEIIISKMGDPVARACFIPAIDWRYVMASDGIRLAVDKQQFDKKFVLEFINYRIFRNKAIESSTGTTRQRIGLVELKQLPFVKPPLSEQRAVATALSDADALIQSLERLIAKKRDIKQGAMQELLTGKRRLPGFGEGKGYKQTEVGMIPEDWVVKCLGNVFSISAGGDLIKEAFQKESDEKHPFPIYSNALTDRGLYGYSKIYRHENNCITVTARGSIGFANMRNHKFDAIGRLLILVPTLHVDCYYMSEFINERVRFSIESTGVPQLTAPQIAKYEIAFPEYEEQAAIATVLSDMDVEITALESKLSKARQIKQGMMQELLTGRIRLV